MVRKYYDTNELSLVNKLRTELESILYFSKGSSNIDFLISSLIDESPLATIDELLYWLRDMNKLEHFQVENIPLSQLRKWNANQKTGDISHESGGFFGIRGLNVSSNTWPISDWQQPIIDQPEIGVLGIITKKINGILYFLMQAKAEPGNINSFQLSPTVQATRSNFLGLHGGKSIKYLEYFLDRTSAEVIVDQLQSEQGSRFFKKRNRNIIVHIHDDVKIEESENHKWVTLGQIKRLLRHDNMVNMDTRSVISCISYIPENINSKKLVSYNDLCDSVFSAKLVSEEINEFDVKNIISAHNNTPSLHSTSYLLHKISEKKFNSKLVSNFIPLNDVEQWCISDNEIYHCDKKYFSVIGVRVNAAGREVLTWDQPIIKHVDSGIIGFITSEINGVTHFLTQLKMEGGSMDILELAPTVQCMTGSYQAGKSPPFVEDVINASSSEVIHNTSQSEEGGRFYHVSNRNITVAKEQPFENSESERYIWMTLRQLQNFIRYNNLINVEARSILSII